jgi:hypothetical protein
MQTTDSCFVQSKTRRKHVARVFHALTFLRVFSVTSSHVEPPKLCSSVSTTRPITQNRIQAYHHCELETRTVQILSRLICSVRNYQK